MDDVAFEFGEGGHHGEAELPLPGRGVGTGQDAGEDPQADAAAVQVVGDDQDVFDGAAEPVQPPDHQTVASVRAEMVQRGSKTGSVALAGGDLLLEDPSAAGLGEGVALQLVVLAVGGDPAQAGPGGDQRWEPPTGLLVPRSSHNPSQLRCGSTYVVRLVMDILSIW